MYLVGLNFSLSRYLDRTFADRIGLTPVTSKSEVARPPYTSVDQVMSFSDFAMPAEFPAFLRHDRLLEYYRQYAEHYALTQCVRFQTRVVQVARAPDFASTGRWNVSWQETPMQHRQVTDDEVDIRSYLSDSLY